MTDASMTEGPLVVVPCPVASERIPNLIPAGEALTAAILAAVSEAPEGRDATQ